ncbi:ABC transporter substrate-binding protein [Picrophilus oshimae]|uniref:Oligopeptide ABC transporter Dpp1, extracellular binding protein n=1 Tax=Picrophilus torridus (strain ATCC 700027 / DSM 9790 / JCM 10055 / NBRC 100828 / KAW 2/3) TaxID=1122961 RepID=Q6L159_PICTO|nr:ABC transporter substrate-binding protein [Picrophilus oshimae]AAT43293.1 oligopeptide ABC transporter Dpp1, extracellular binding protein [Picrophilus oshimae DSM 9789]
MYDIPEPEVGPERPRSKAAKWYAMIVVIIVIISAFGIISLDHPAFPRPYISASYSRDASIGLPYTITVKTSSPFKNITVFWGDDTYNTIYYSGSDVFKISHIYKYPGEYYIYYTGNFTNGFYNGNKSLIPVYIPFKNTSNISAQGILSIIYNRNNHVELSATTTGNPVNKNYSVIYQSITLFKNGSYLNKYNLTYVYNESLGYYTPLNNTLYLDLKNGYYNAYLSTTSGEIIKSVNYYKIYAVNTRLNGLVYNNASNISSLYYINGTAVYKNNTCARMAGNGSFYYSGGIDIKNDIVYIYNGTTINGNLSMDIIGSTRISNMTLTGNFSTNNKIKFDSGTLAVIKDLSGKLSGNIFLFNGDKFKILNNTMVSFNNDNITYMNSSYINYNKSHAVKYVYKYYYKISGYKNETKTGYYLDFFVGNSSISSNYMGYSITYGAVSPYNNLDPQLASSPADLEILYNTYSTLVSDINGTYVPDLAEYLPAPGHGISGNYTNYTFKIRPDAQFQNGSRVTPWDVMYSIARDILLSNRTGSPGWIVADYLLGNYNDHNFYNITGAITINNLTDEVTFHFKQPISPERVFMIFSSPGTFIIDPQWLKSINASFAWSPSGFSSYSKYYNKTIKSVFSDGPYEVYYSIPDYKIVLIKNPYYIGSKINENAPYIVRIVYEDSESDLYQSIRSNETQIIETSYYTGTMYNISAGSFVNIISFSDNVNGTLLSRYSYYNFPLNIFSNYYARNMIYSIYLYTVTHDKSYLNESKNDWSYIVKLDKNITYASGIYLYNGKKIVIPVFSGYSQPDTELTYISGYLSDIIKGGSFPIIPVPSSYIYSNNSYMPLYDISIYNTTEDITGMVINHLKSMNLNSTEIKMIYNISRDYMKNINNYPLIKNMSYQYNLFIISKSYRSNIIYNPHYSLNDACNGYIIYFNYVS